MEVRVILTGVALVDSKSAIKRVLSKTYQNTSKFAIETVKNITPVRTGRMKEGWGISRDSSVTLKIENKVPYAGFVDARQKIVERSRGDIESYFKTELSNNAVIELNSR